MNKNNFPPGFENDAQNIGIDFDGVIHNMDKGFFDGTVYGDPIPGALDALKLLSESYTIIIYTAKAKPSRPLVNGKTGIELVWEWLEKYNVAQYVKEVTAEKPRAILYIDDNGYRFNNWGATLNFIKTL
jgi:hypothetical protein